MVSTMPVEGTGETLQEEGGFWCQCAMIRFVKLLLKGASMLCGGGYLETLVTSHAPLLGDLAARPRSSPPLHDSLTWTLDCSRSLGSSGSWTLSVHHPITLGFSVPWRVVAHSLVTVDQLWLRKLSKLPCHPTGVTILSITRSKTQAWGVGPPPSSPFPFQQRSYPLESTLHHFLEFVL